MLKRSLAVAAMLCCSTGARAQANDSTVKATPARAPAPTRKTVVTLNPFAVFAAFFTADVERAVSQSVSIGASGSIAGDNDFNNYGALEGKVRYYPNEKVLQGFSIAAALGFSTARDDNNIILANNQGGTQTISYTSAYTQRVTRGTIGMDLSYQWLLGPKRRFVTVLGAGMKRFFGSEAYVDPFSAPVIPTARVNIGFAF
jgi:hypothetical protein